MRTWLEIDKKALLHNLEQFLNLIGPNVKLMAVVKANAYGHGFKEVVQIINGVIASEAKQSREIKNGIATSPSAPRDDMIWFGVDTIDEALILRQEGIQSPILILGYVPLDRLREAVENDIRLTVYNRETIEMLGKIISKNPSQPPLNRGGVIQDFPSDKGERPPLNPPLNKGETEGVSPIRVHVKIETGTFRQGVRESEILDFVKFIQQFPQIEIEGLSTHFANIEDTNDNSYAQGQLDAFKRIVGVLEANDIGIPVKHTACSAATIAFPETHFNMVRVGISLYGLWSFGSSHDFKGERPSLYLPLNKGERPSLYLPLNKGERPSLYLPLNKGEKEGVSQRQISLQPVLSWKTIIAQIKKIPAGTAVGYGLTERVSRDSKIAVIPVGYYDGYDRKLSSVGQVLIHGQRCKVIGRVCMNMIMVDVTEVPEARLEDEVVLLGSQGNDRISAEELAQKIGTINYEVIARLNPLLCRKIV